VRAGCGAGAVLYLRIGEVGILGEAAKIGMFLDREVAGLTIRGNRERIPAPGGLESSQ